METSENDTFQPRRYHQFEFTGSAGEYFRIWIVNVLLTIVTLGIYSAWAKVRTNRYFYGNTLLDGSAFDYTADPVRILIGRLIAVGLLVIYQVSVGISTVFSGWVLIAAAFILPLIVVMSMRFRTRYSTWRGIHFGFAPDLPKAYLLFSPIIIVVLVMGFGNIFFGEMIDTQSDAEMTGEGNFMEQFGIYISIFVLTILIGWLLFPWWQCRYYSFIGNRVRYGTSQFRFNASAWDFYGMYFGAFIVSLVSLFAFMVLGMLIALLFGVLTGGFNFNTEGPIISTILGLLAILFVQAALKAYIQTRRTNIVYSHLEVEDVCFISELQFRKMLYLYLTNTLAILFSLGLAIPWAKIRVAHYRAETMRLFASNFEQFVAQSAQQVDAKADAVSDLFDFDLGL